MGLVKLYQRGHLQHEIPISDVLPLHDPERPYRCYALHASPPRDASGDEVHYAVCLASSAEGEAFLQGLSRRSSISPSTGCDPVSLQLLRSLSDELLLLIFSFLPPADLLRSAQVCVQWNILSSDHTLWRRAYVKAFGSAKPEPGLRWKEQFLRHAHWRRPRSSSSSDDETQRPTRIIKLVAVGDSVGSEKTALLMAYAHDQFPDDYVPTVFEKCAALLFASPRISVLTCFLLQQCGQFAGRRLQCRAPVRTSTRNDVVMSLNVGSLWDTTGAEQYDRLRPLSYANANVFLLVFSVVEPASFDNILNKVSEQRDLSFLCV